MRESLSVIWCLSIVACGVGCTSAVYRFNGRDAGDAGADLGGMAADVAPDGADVPADRALVDSADDEIDAPADGALIDTADAATGLDVDIDAGDVRREACDACAGIAAPRLVAPLSTTAVTSHTPRLRWELRPATDGARIELCRERACTTVVHRFETIGSVASTPLALTPGTWFWRAYGVRGGLVGTTSSAVWQLRVGSRSTTVNTSWAQGVDVNGDGFGDVVIGDGNGLHAHHGARTGLSETGIDIATGGEVRAIAGIGCDVNGDGFGDVVVGLSDGVTRVFIGGPAGLSATPAWTLMLSRTGGVTASLGDVNGDGYCDLGADGATALGSLGGPIDPRGSLGAVFRMGDTNGDGVADYARCAGSGCSIFHGSSAGGREARASEVAAGIRGVGDINGDGFADGCISTFIGEPGSVTPIGTTLLGSAASIRASAQIPGLCPRGVGDVDNDGFADAMGSSGFLIRGGADWPEARVTIVGADGTTAVRGNRVGLSGDVDGDGGDDFVVYEPASSIVLVYLSRDRTAPRRPSLTLPLSPSGGAYNAVSPE